MLVVCEATELVVKRLCQDELAAHLTALGATATIEPEVSNQTPGRPIAAEQYLPAARAAGAKAVLSAGMLPTRSISAPGLLSVSALVGSEGRVDIAAAESALVSALPFRWDGGQPSTGYAVNSTITDVATGRTMWTAKASTGPSSDTSAQVSELAKAVANAALQAGFF